jgi:hypothetical protein
MELGLIRIEGDVVWNFGRDPTTGTWVCQCERLRLSTIGYSFGDMKRNIDRDTDRFFRDFLNDGRLDALLKNLGLTWTSEPPAASTEDVRGRRHFDLPYELRRISPAAAAEIARVQFPYLAQTTKR